MPGCSIESDQRVVLGGKVAKRKHAVPIKCYVESMQIDSMARQLKLTGQDCKLVQSIAQ